MKKRSTSCFCSKISSRSRNLQTRNPALGNMLFVASHQLYWSSLGGLAGSVCWQRDNWIIHFLGEAACVLICLFLLLLLLLPLPGPGQASLQLDSPLPLPSPAGGLHCLPSCHTIQSDWIWVNAWANSTLIRICSSICFDFR